MAKFKMLLFTIYSLMSLQNFAQYIRPDGFFSGKPHTDMNFFVALPANYDTTYLYPVIYVLDTDLLFYETVAAAFYNASYDYMPPVIVTGINYITPKNRSDSGFHIDRLELTGKGGDFADYIRTEPIPYIHKKYAAGKSSIMGYSYTGAYLYWRFLRKHTCFDNYIVLSPETCGLRPDKLGSGISDRLHGKRLICITAKKDFTHGHPLILYYKGEISARYNFQNQQRIGDLMQALKNKESLAGHNITEDNILFCISEYDSNLKDRERALAYIQKALSVAPGTTQYKALQKKYTSI